MDYVWYIQTICSKSKQRGQKKVLVKLTTIGNVIKQKVLI